MSKTNKNIYILLLVVSFTLVFSAKVFAAITISSNAITGTGSSTLDLGSGNDLYLQTSSGKVGIGTSNPSKTLDVAGSIGGNSLTAQSSQILTLQGGTGSATAGKITVGAGSTGEIIITPGANMTPGFHEYLYINPSTDTSALTFDTFGNRTTWTVNSSAVDYHSAALVGQLIVPSSNALNSTQFLAGGDMYVKHQGTGTLSEAIGTIGVIQIAGNGNIAEANAFESEMKMDSGSGRFLTARSYYAKPPSNAAGAADPNLFVGFDAADFGVDGGVATDVYAFRSLGNTKSLFSGPVTFGGQVNLSNGPLVSSGTAQSSTTTTGDIQTAGGVGIAKNITMGGILYLGTTGSNLGGNGIVWGAGSTTEGISRINSGNFKWYGGGSLSLDMDVKPNLNATYDLGTSSTKWRQLFVSGASVTGTLATTSWLGVSTSAPDKVLEVNLGTSDAFRLSYNDSNGGATTYMDTTLSSVGLTTFTAVGSAPGFVFNSKVRLKGYTVATLPAGTQGDTAYVTDATTPTYNGALVGGGAVVVPVFYNGTAWVSH